MVVRSKLLSLDSHRFLTDFHGCICGNPLAIRGNPHRLEDIDYYKIDHFLSLNILESLWLHQHKFQNHQKNRDFQRGLSAVAGAAAESAAICAILRCAGYASGNWLTAANCRESQSPAGKFTDFHRFFWGFPQIHP